MNLTKRIFRLVEGTIDATLSLGMASLQLRHAFYRVPALSSRPILVLGNGPSAQETITALMPHRDKFLIACVNDFYKSEQFSVVRPDIYIIADPMYWLPETIAVYGTPLIAGMLKQVTWKMDFALPADGFTLIGRKLQENKSLTIFPYNRTRVAGFFWFRRLFYRFGLGMPRPQNVLVPAIFILLKAGASRLYLAGAEHTWHQTLHLSDDNVLYVTQTRGYSGVSPSVPFYKIEGGTVFNVPEIFEAWAAVHRSYHDLSEWSQQLEARIENLTPVTFIDAFPRSSVDRVIAHYQ